MILSLFLLSMFLSSVYSQFYKTISPTVTVYIPSITCFIDNCPPSLGNCSESNECVFGNGYNGLLTSPTATATHYCNLTANSCNGAAGDITNVLSEVLDYFDSLQYKYCNVTSENGCIGIAAVNPNMYGNYQAKFPNSWGLGLTANSSLCYKLTGSNEKFVTVAVTDRCGGYATCPPHEVSPAESSNCLPPFDPSPSTNLTLLCQCQGTAGIFGNCNKNNTCDWCAASNHPHFDLDIHTFNYLCGSDGFYAGHCSLSSVTPIQCTKGNTHDIEINEL
mmetsp:Transcript_6249/g.5582  ORF Transcript_6249/g.5582 Transcript_6249/m.5582 type:complete len:277 (-) Transcript_6249:31-861(-)